MKLKSKLKIILMLSFAFVMLSAVKSFATTISVTPSKSNVSPGETFNVTISGNDATGRVNISASNGTVSQSSAWIENNSVVVTVTAGNSGSVTISASGELSSNSGVDTDVSKSASVTIQAPNTNPGGNTGGNNNQGGNNNNQGGTTTSQDTNANLRSLGFSPKEYDTFIFNVNTLEYSVSVPNEVASINVYANASSSSATISGAGTRNLQEGTNRINVTVTAQAGNTKTYSILVTRAVGSDGEVPPNVIDEPIDEEVPTVNGFSNLELPGFELDKEFKTDVYEYLVKTEEKITKEWLEEIKEKLVYVATNEAFTVDTIVEVTEEEKKGTITIIVKDEENEIAKYVITFEKEVKQEPVVALVTDSNSKNNSLIDLTFENRVYIAVAIYVVTLLAAIFFAINCYIKDRRIEEYDDEQEFEEDSEFEKMNEFYIGVNSNLDDKKNNEDDTPKTFAKEESAEDTAGEVISSSRRLGGYRNLRNTNRSSGRHF